MNYIKNIQDSEIAENNKNLVDNIVTSLLFLFYSTRITTSRINNIENNIVTYNTVIVTIPFF